MKKITLIALAILFIPYCLLAQNEVARIDSLVEKYLDNAEFTGNVLVAKGGKILLNKSYGYSNTNDKKLHAEHTIFNIASLTKTFTAALILKLQEDGKLSVHDTLNKYHPDFPNGERITIHQLLTHTSGIPNYTDDKAFQMMDQKGEVSLHQMMSFFKDKPLAFEPGTQFRYSNSGYTMLGYIIEKLTGMSYGKALEHFIFKPLGMQHTSFGPPADKQHLATGYMMYYKNFSNPSFAVHPTISYATGAIYSTVEDLYKWHLALQKGAFLSPASLEAAYRKDKGAYGYGWFTDSLYGKARVSHDGNIPGYKANINRIPGDDVCVIALSNANSSSVGGMVRNIMNILYGQPLSKTFAEQPVIAMPDSIKSAFAGTYKFREEDAFKISVQLKDSVLMVSMAGQPAFPIYPVGRNAFKSGNTRVEFIMNKEGKPEQIFIYAKGEIAGGRKAD